ncbi:aromatic ring-opening dioxygenase family protein [Xylariales sp. AK1849]|nr:aromatic ring-opening dioxygenase family protein [Xylariales sp. AK1849]
MAQSPTPLIFVSHGSTMMLGEQSVVTRDWQETGRKIEKRGVKSIIVMGAHWETVGPNRVKVSTNPQPGRTRAAWVHPDKFANYQINCSPALGKRVVNLLRDGGIDAVEDSKDDWIHDSLIPLKWMFPTTCPPCTLISLNTKYEPVFHSYIGSLLGHLRDEGILLLGTGGAVHNLYRNYWPQVVFARNCFAQEQPPKQWALDFRQCMYDVMTQRAEGDDDGQVLREGMTRLMHHPLFREAHGTDDHFMAACYLAGAARKGDVGKKTSEVWELRNMCDAQFTLGSWD